MPITPFIGVRISWLMLARNSLLARLAASAASRRGIQVGNQAEPGDSQGHLVGDGLPGPSARPTTADRRHVTARIPSSSGPWPSGKPDDAPVDARTSRRRARSPAFPGTLPRSGDRRQRARRPTRPRRRRPPASAIPHWPSDSSPGFSGSSAQTRAGPEAGSRQYAQTAFEHGLDGLLHASARRRSRQASARAVHAPPAGPRTIFGSVRSLITPTACQRPSRRNVETLSSTGIS